VSEPKEGAAAPSGEEDGRYGVRVLIGSGDARKTVYFRPAPESITLGQSDVGNGTASRTQTVVGTPNGNLDINTTEDTLGLERGWGLVVGAAAECGVLPAGDDDLNPFYSTYAWHKPWDPDAASLQFPQAAPAAWFVFGGRRSANGRPVFLSCQEQIAHEEALLCMADKLSEAADTVKPIVWRGMASYGPSWFGPLGTEWTIPPQDAEQKFILPLPAAG